MEKQIQEQPHADNKENYAETHHTFWQVYSQSVGPAHVGPWEIHTFVRPHLRDTSPAQIWSVILINFHRHRTFVIALSSFKLTSVSYLLSALRSVRHIIFFFTHDLAERCFLNNVHDARAAGRDGRLYTFALFARPSSPFSYSTV